MWRSLFLYLSTNPTLRRVATSGGLARRVASRFVAGETLEDALAVAGELNRRRASVQIDYLGESVADPEQAKEAMVTYLEILDRIAEAGLDSQVSLKPSQMGQELSDDLCLANIEKVVQRAAERGGFVWVDMEGSASTARTVELYRRLRQQHEKVGIALQAYLYRTRADLEGVVSIGGRVRLCKGAYQEPAAVAFPKKRDVDRSFALLSETLLSSGRYQAIATHDERMIDHAIRYARAHGIARESFEFQLLHGVRRDLQERLLREGYRVRIYLPYGSQWYPYFMRRLAERPANLVFLLGNLVREARSRP